MKNVKNSLFLFFLLTINILLLPQSFDNKVILQQQLGRDVTFMTVRAASNEESGILWNTTGNNASRWLVSIDGKPHDIRKQTWIPYVAQVKGAEKTLYYDDVIYTYIQELNILDDQQYATLTFSFINNSDNTVVLTPKLFLDTNFGDANDNSDGNPLFLTTRRLIDKETELTGDNIPTWVQLPDGPSGSILTFIFDDFLVDVPQKIKMANYFRFKANANNMDFNADGTRGFQTMHRPQVDKAILLSFTPRSVPRFSKDEIVILFGIDKKFSGNDTFPHISSLLRKDSEALPPQDPPPPQENFMEDLDALIEQADALLDGNNQLNDESVEDLENKMENLQNRMSEQ